MSKVLDVLKKIPNAYYNWKKRNENLASFLEKASNNQKQFDRIEATVNKLQSDVNELKTQVKDLHDDTNTISDRLDIIQEGTKMELFETLHNWRSILVLRGWASQTEKHDVEAIWKIYNGELKGNGQGSHYYNEIINLPESEEEMIKRRAS